MLQYHDSKPLFQYIKLESANLTVINSESYVQTLVNLKFKMFEKVLKVSMVTTCFGKYGHHRVLKYVVGKLLLFIVAATACVVPQMSICVVLGVLCSFMFVVTRLVLD
jgi:hypothetical protein